MSQNTTETTYDRFASAVRRYDVGITRVPPSDVPAAIERTVEQPAVGTPLPFEGIELPDSVGTEPTATDLERAKTGVTAASLGVAEYGSVLLPTDEHGSEPVSLFNDLHVAVLRERDIVPDMAAVFEHVGELAREHRQSAILATGPSATADMGALVQGAHGPKRVELLVIS